MKFNEPPGRQSRCTAVGCGGGAGVKSATQIPLARVENMRQPQHHRARAKALRHLLPPLYPAIKLRSGESVFEAGDVDLLRALRRCGHLPGGLQGADDLGLTPAYLAVHFDQPAVLDFLREDGVDLTVACDGVGADGHGTPAFYAAFHGKVRVLRALARLGVAMEAPCTRFGEAPAEFFDRHGPAVAEQLRAAANFRHATATRLARFRF